jgi:hypothetical protein
MDAPSDLVHYVLDNPIVGCGGATKHRRAQRQLIQNPDDPSVVRAKIVAPVGDAVCFVDD